MKKILYTLVGEGFAEYEFIPAYLEWVAERNRIEFIRTRIQVAVSKQGGISRVLEEIKPLCELSFVSDKPVNLFVAGIDLDKSDYTDEQEHHEIRKFQLIKCLGKLHQKFGDKIILFVPIQAIDYWIHYQQVTPTANSLESKSKDEIKKLVYGRKDADRQQIKRIARTVGESADFDELAKQSRSFKHFHDQVSDFLNRASQ